MIKKDRRSDIKIGIPFLNSDNIPDYPLYSFKLEFFTSDNNKKTVSALYNSSDNSYAFNGCFFKEVTYNGIEGNKPILVIPLNNPKFEAGRLKCNIYIYTDDTDFIDNKQTTVKEIQTNILIT